MRVVHCMHAICVHSRSPTFVVLTSPLPPPFPTTDLAEVGRVGRVDQGHGSKEEREGEEGAMKSHG